MKRLIAFIILFLISSSFTKEDVKYYSGCIELDIVIIADLSSSVAGREQYIHDAVYTFIDKFELADNGIRVGLITFSSLAHLIYPLSSNKDSLKIAANYIRPSVADGDTNLTQALELTVQEFITNGRKRVMKMAILITDGEPDNFPEAEKTAALIKSLPGTFIWGIFITKMEKDTSIWQYYQRYSSSTTGLENLKKIASPNCFIESDYNNLVDQIKKLDICL